MFLKQSTIVLKIGFQILAYLQIFIAYFLGKVRKISSFFRPLLLSTADNFCL